MVIRKLSWICSELLLIGIFLYMGSSAAMALAVLLILIPVLSIPINLSVRRKLEFSLRAEGNMHKNSSGNVQIQIKNTSAIPVVCLCFLISVENQLNREAEVLRVASSVWPKSHQIEKMTLSSNHCGRLKLSVRSIKLYDCFGLIGIRCKCHAVTHLPVLADTFAMQLRMLPMAVKGEDCEVYSQERIGSDLTETFQIRDYVPGDSPRQVHWKLSGKFDRLIVRDPSLPILHSVLVFWERTGETGDRDFIEAQAEIVISLCKALLDEAVAFTLGWNDTDRGICVIHEIADMDALVGVIPRLLRATGMREGVSGAELLLRTRADALCAHMIYIAERPQSAYMELRHFGNVTVLSGTAASERTFCFDSADYRDQLALLEI